MAAEFTTDGFDLDALACTEEAAGDGGTDVIYEVGGGATVVAENHAHSLEEKNDNGIVEAETLKAQGNSEFKNGHFMEAYDMYTMAISKCPTNLKGVEILRQRDEFNETERAKAFSRQRMEEETIQHQNDETGGSSNPRTRQPSSEFQLPPQPHGDLLAIYYCNRAAALLQMDRYDDAVRDCDVSALLCPNYTKAYVRRSTAYEKSNKTEEALRDARKALELEPGNAIISKNVARLKKVETERLEKLKEETLGKLKDLGNSLLGNFGLSLDNFQAVQDKRTGSYSISFNQDAK